MYKKTVTIVLAVMMCVNMCGCYDMSDIEDISAVMAVFVDTDSITYCTVTASAEEKRYNYNLYETHRGNLYQGIEELVVQSGKEISLSHLESIMFSVECDNERVKDNMNALLGRTNSHPKAPVAYFEGDGYGFAKSVVDIADNGDGKRLRHILDNRFSGNVSCRAMELGYALNFSDKGVVAPVITVADGKLSYTGIVYADYNKSAYIGKPYSDIITAVKNKGKTITYGDGGATEIRCTSYDVQYNKSDNSAEVFVGFEYGGYGSEGDGVGKGLRQGVEYIFDLRNDGYDLTELCSEIKKEYYTISDFERFAKAYGSGTDCVRDVDVSVKVTVEREG